MPSPPAAIDSSASIGRCQACARTSSPTRVTAAPSGNAAAKNRASNRRGIDGGVTQRDSGTSRSVRSRRSSASAIAGKAPGSASSRDRAPTRSAPGPRPPAARPPPRTPPGSRRCARPAPSPAPDPRRAARPPRPADRTDLAASAGSASAASTRPPGTRACPARTPSSPADASAGPRARRARPHQTTVRGAAAEYRLRLGQGSLGAVPRARRRR